MKPNKTIMGVSGALVAIMAVAGGKYAHADNAYNETLDARLPALTIAGVTPEYYERTRTAYDAAKAVFIADMKNWPLKPVPSADEALKHARIEEARRAAEPFTLD